MTENAAWWVFVDGLIRLSRGSSNETSPSTQHQSVQQMHINAA